MQKRINLKTFEDQNFYYYDHRLINQIEELENWIQDNQWMNQNSFAKSVLFSHEIKFNNAIEDYKDDIDFIRKTITSQKEILTKQEQIILNLYHGYRFIFDSPKEINKENLRDLYQILSKFLLEPYDLENMGPYYREKDVYIYYSENINTPPDMGIDPIKIHDYMEQLFSFIDQPLTNCSLTEQYIKSQIIHFYFVYLHPYFDINGRTARTIGIWYLLNNQAFPYIIFNRGIALKKNEYYKVILEAKKFHNLNFFLTYMLETVLVELQKEYVIKVLDDNCTTPLSEADYQTLQYILSIKGLKTANDFRKFYNLQIEKKSGKEILETMIAPLLDKNILKLVRKTNSYVYGTTPNFIFEINPKKLDVDPQKIRHLKL